MATFNANKSAYVNAILITYFLMTNLHMIGAHDALTSINARASEISQNKEKAYGLRQAVALCQQTPLDSLRH